MRSQQPSKNLLQLTFQADGEGRGSFFRYHPETGTLSGEPGAHSAHGRKAPGGRIPLWDGRICMDIFVDRSLTEGFFQGEKAMSLRSYGLRRPGGCCWPAAKERGFSGWRCGG